MDIYILAFKKHFYIMVLVSDLGETLINQIFSLVFLNASYSTSGCSWSSRNVLYKIINSTTFSRRLYSKQLIKRTIDSNKINKRAMILYCIDTISFVT